jgi:site-specific DNA-methyltransferase (adenine-specific)
MTTAQPTITKAQDNQAFLYSSFRLSPSGLSPLGTPTLQQWLACGNFLRRAEGSVHFWIGDWLAYGQVHFRKDYEQATAVTGYSYQTLRKDKYLAQRIPPERRRSDVDVAIYHELAPLDEKNQDLLLEKVQTQGLTVQQLRVEKHRLLIDTQRAKTAYTDPVLFLGDCVEVVQQLPDNSIDCIVTDPPYGINYQSEHRTLPFAYMVNDDEHAYEVLGQALAAASPKLKDNSHIYVFTNWRAYPHMAAVVANYFTIKNVLIWEKNNTTPGDLEGNYAHQYEMIIFAHKGRRLLFGGPDPNVLHFARVVETNMQHPTEKPIKLLEYLIGKSTAKGETVLDLFMGSGSTCLAAKHTNRNYIGIEIDKQWYQVAQQRLQQEN